MSKAIENIFYHLVMADRENDLMKRLQHLSTTVSLLKAKIQKDIPEDEELNFIVSYPAVTGDNITVTVEEVTNKYDLIDDEIRSILPYYRERDRELGRYHRLGVLSEIQRAIEIVFSEYAEGLHQKEFDEATPLYLQAYESAEKEAEWKSVTTLHANLILQYGKEAIYTILVALGWDTILPQDIFSESKNITLPKRGEKFAKHTL